MNPLAKTAIAALSIGAICAEPPEARAAAITVPEAAIRSLSGAPEVVSARQWRVGQGQPGLTLTLRFANECLATAGADVAGAHDDRGTLFAVVGQRINSEGCPDIYQPVDRQVTIDFSAVPGAAEAERLLIVARGGSGTGVFAPEPDGEPGGSTFVARPLSVRGVLAPFDFGSIALDPSGAGYTLRGTVGIASDCSSNLLEALVFEIPDAEGTPSQDALALLLPEECANSGTAQTILITVETPQRNSGRRVHVLNSATLTTRL